MKEKFSRSPEQGQGTPFWKVAAYVAIGVTTGFMAGLYSGHRSALEYHYPQEITKHYDE